MTTTQTIERPAPRAAATRRRATSRPAPSSLAGRTAPADRPLPLPPTAVSALARSDAELVAAQLAGSPDEQFLHAHLAALRAGAAVLEVTGRPVRRPQPRTVWEMVSLVEPSLAERCAFFAAGAALRAAVESGRGEVEPARAEITLAAAEDFADAVRAVIDPAAGVRAPALWAS